MIKLSICVVLILLIAYLGYGIERYYSFKLKLAKEYNSFVSYVSRETTFLKSTVVDMIENYNFSSKELKNLLLNEVNGTFNEIDKRISATLKDEIKLFLKELCTCDFGRLKFVVNNALEKSEILVKDAENDRRQKGELARKVIILIGIGLIIILI
jgi:hypothetical protein